MPANVGLLWEQPHIELCPVALDPQSPVVLTFGSPFPCIQSRAFIVHSLISLVAKVNKEVIRSVLRELTCGQQWIEWTGVEWTGRNLTDESKENQRAKCEKRHVESSQGENCMIPLETGRGE